MDFSILPGYEYPQTTIAMCHTIYSESSLLMEKSFLPIAFWKVVVYLFLTIEKLLRKNLIG